MSFHIVLEIDSIWLCENIGSIVCVDTWAQWYFSIIHILYLYTVHIICTFLYYIFIQILYYTLKKMVLYSTKSGSWLVIIGEPLLVLYSTKSLKVHLCHMVLCRTIKGAILHCISSTKMVLNSTNSGSLARKEPLKGLNRFFVWQWCYIAP